MDHDGLDRVDDAGAASAEPDVVPWETLPDEMWVAILDYVNDDESGATDNTTTVLSHMTNVSPRMRRLAIESLRKRGPISLTDYFRPKIPVGDVFYAASQTKRIIDVLGSMAKKGVVFALSEYEMRYRDNPRGPTRSLSITNEIFSTIIGSSRHVVIDLRTSAFGANPRHLPNSALNALRLMISSRPSDLANIEELTLLNGEHVDDDMLSTLIDICPDLVQLTLNKLSARLGDYEVHVQWDRSIRTIGSLQYCSTLVLKECGDALVNSLLNTFQSDTVTRLEIRGTLWGGDHQASLTHIPINLPNLEYFYINMRSHRDVTDEMLRPLTQNVRLVRLFVIGGRLKCTDAIVEELAMALPRLRLLDLSSLDVGSEQLFGVQSNVAMINHPNKLRVVQKPNITAHFGVKRWVGRCWMSN